jgi:hypothetical protein
MARQITDATGTRWHVTLSGRSTAYGRDELSLEFRRVGPPAESRYCRFSPRGAKAGEMALEECTDRELITLLAASQPAWTAPEPAAS